MNTLEDSMEFDDGSGVTQSPARNRKTSPGQRKGAADPASPIDGSNLNNHLSLRPRASWAFADGKSQAGQVFMDEAKKMILFYADSAITIKDFENNTQDTYQLGLREGERLFWAEVSPDLKYLLVHAMSRPQWIKIYSLDHGKAQERYLVQGGRRAGSIEQVHWTEPGNLFIVSPSGVEFYQIPNRDALSLVEKWTLGEKDLRLLKEFKMPVPFSLYYASTRVLLAYNGVKGGKAKFEGFFFKQDFVMKLPKFEIDLGGFDIGLTSANFALCRLYERLYCVHIEERQITMYQITKSAISRRATISLDGRPLPHRLRIQSIDNLLAVHNSEAKARERVTTLYDIRSSQSADDGVVLPIAAGLSIAPFSYEGNAVTLYQERWQYFAPNYVLDLDEEKLFEVGLELSHIVDSFPEKERLIQFLLRRNQSRGLALDIIRNSIHEGIPLSVLSKIFDAINLVAADIAPPTNDKPTRSITSAGPITRTTTVSPAGKAPLPPVSVIPSGSLSSPITYRDGRDASLSPSTSSSSPSSLPESPSTFWNSSTGSSSSSPMLSTLSSPFFSSSSSISSLSSSSSASSSPFMPTSSSSGFNSPASQVSPSASLASLPQLQPFSAWDVKIVEEKRARGGQLLLDQHDIYNHVFMPIDDCKGAESKYFVSVLTEYVRSLNFYKQHVEHYIYKLIIQYLITSNRYYQLHQFLQYHVIGDSVHVACQLLSVEKNYPPAYQLALDMLKRLSTTRKVVKDQIVEVLLTRDQLLPALRFIRNNADVSVMPERFLEVALKRDENMFYTVYKFFEKRGEINKECAPYIKTFCRMFPDGDRSSLMSPMQDNDFSSGDDSGPSSSTSSLTTFSDLTNSSSPYASPAPSPLSTPKRGGGTGGKKARGLAF